MNGYVICTLFLYNSSASLSLPYSPPYGSSLSIRQVLEIWIHYEALWEALWVGQCRGQVSSYSTRKKCLSFSLSRLPPSSHSLSHAQSKLCTNAGKLVVNQPHDEEVALDSDGSIEFDPQQHHGRGPGSDGSQDDLG